MSISRAEQEREAAQRRADAAHLMGLPQFQRLAYWLMFQLAPIDGPIPAGADTHQTALLLGRRSVSLDVGSLLRAANFKEWQRMEHDAEMRRQAPILQGSPDSSGHG